MHKNTLALHFALKFLYIPSSVPTAADLTYPCWWISVSEQRKKDHTVQSGQVNQPSSTGRAKQLPLQAPRCRRQWGAATAPRSRGTQWIPARQDAPACPARFDLRIGSSPSTNAPWSSQISCCQKDVDAYGRACPCRHRKQLRPMARKQGLTSFGSRKRGDRKRRRSWPLSQA
jgi:hypothetical protein